MPIYSSKAPTPGFVCNTSYLEPWEQGLGKDSLVIEMTRDGQTFPVKCR
ncbi:hypothetical protein AVEN_237868-1, partial [Araneus ventricosus]